MASIKKFIGSLLSPVYILDKKMDALTRGLLATQVLPGTQWLDIGCGLQPFLSSFKNAHYTGLDIEVSGRGIALKTPDKFFNGVNIPFEDNSFDGILCTQVLEHAEHVDLLVAECYRVLKKSGVFIVSVPFVFREHEQPYDFRRFTSYGLMHLLDRHGFSVISSHKCLSAIETISTLFNVYVNNNIGSRSRLLYFLTGTLLILPSSIFSALLSKILPDNGHLFCTLVVAATPKMVKNILL